MPPACKVTNFSRNKQDFQQLNYSILRDACRCGFGWRPESDGTGCQGCGKAIGRQVQPVAENKVGLCAHKVGL